MNRYAIFLTYPEQQLVAIEVGYVTHVTAAPREDEIGTICHLYAGPRLIIVVKAELDDVLNQLRNAS